MTPVFDDIIPSIKAFGRKEISATPLRTKVVVCSIYVCYFLFELNSALLTIDFHELSPEQRNAFMSDVAKVGNAITEAFHPHKINYGAYADTISHLHMHVVPKFKDGFGFGGVFEMNPQKTYLSDSEHHKIIEKIKLAL